ncbi:bifunctional diaminohydroxyphosphoribosylaminopyrimidine deaminase/5-amino-6-(5-phosphoribosylamino)uracil reductase RibD [Ampullimonas aquatilis]|uniref:bifunctional diaminohydroxyphosphoribosylaminopyrimidine deaminase/5-amino-6-(5-phosphoribosylamino)uracil reductase RibD n=1 Tax=Ampullimonas aquatilis TaxID=1341549 RepID=UPI003C72012C
MNSSDFDIWAMRQALTLAEHALYSSSPNPRVGCVLALNNKIIGEGFTQEAGRNHAEVEAVLDAQRRGNSVAGATAYVTLEPCSHFGRTPPCADMLIANGIARVVVAMEDPNPVVSGQGLARLISAGMDVSVGLMATEATELNLGFVKRMKTGLPWFRLKAAISLDGFTALQNGQSQWITSESARSDGHHWRARACAILTGVGTILADDPLLNVRHVATSRQPPRFIVDSHLRIPLTSRILAEKGITIFYCLADSHKTQVLAEMGVEVCPLPATESNQVDLTALKAELGRRAYNEVHIEAGAELNGALIRNKLVNELLIYQAPDLLGGGKKMANLPVLAKLDDKQQLKFSAIEQVGRDLRILARFENDV